MYSADGERLLGRRRRWWEDNVKLDLGQTGLDVMDWILLVLDRGHWRTPVNTAMNILVPYNVRKLLNT
jgi:hypothetical protein